MIDTDKYERTTPELEEFEGENLGDLITNLLAEVERLNNIISTFDEFMCQLPQRYTEGTMRLWNELVNKHYLTSFTTFMEMMKND